MSMSVNKILNSLYEGPVVGVVFDSSEDAPELVKTALVAPGKMYHYRTSVPLEIGDFVIVHAPKGYAVACVVTVGDENLLDLEYDGIYKSIICKLDLTAYQQQLEADKAILAEIRNQQRKSIRQQVLDRVGQSGIDVAALQSSGIKANG